ncbi:MAG: hypothetical protein ACRC1R_04985 [Cetobacterium sp.]|uniref:hypothetical protein n=1 Tax=Cetobacterium sp. TaxID=2071632 RepID=UPI003F35AB30
MRKIYYGILFITLNLIVKGEIKIKIFEPIRFNDIVREEIGRNISVGRGVIEISTDDLKADMGKKLVFNFPEKGLMTNRKKWIKIEKYRLENRDREIIIKNKIHHVNFYAILDKKSIDGGEDPKVIEGDYVGYVPIIISQYGRVIR